MNKVAQFEKVSYEQFKEDMIDTFDNFYSEEDIRKFYDEIELPVRATKFSAGHDIKIPFKKSIQSDCTFKIPTGIRCKMEEGYVMLVFPRSSLGIKKGLFITNTIPVIDADYYNAKNEGHIFICVKNTGNELLVLNQNDAITQAVFVPYGVADDGEILTERTGGIGSTTKNV